MVALGAGLLVTFLGIPVLAAALAGCRASRAGTARRARAARLECADPEPLRTRKPAGGLDGRAAQERLLLRHALYALVQFPWAVFHVLVAVTFWTCGWGLLTYPLWFWVFPAYAGEGGSAAVRRRPPQRLSRQTPSRSP
ncbi:sensor domain-containing protein [Streptomyces echinatus]|uniref:sensor domain-containing protein n=1 Tax=Streptomyces echinatus TaxID=67293 RepID=UPI0031E890C5